MFAAEKTDDQSAGTFIAEILRNIRCILSESSVYVLVYVSPPPAAAAAPPKSKKKKTKAIK